MSARGKIAAALTLFLLGPPLPAQDLLQAERRGDMEARLTVEATKPRPHIPGIGEVTLTLVIEGPSSLDVEEPQLGDPTAAWKEERSSATRAADKGRTTWRQILRLKQVKPGIVLPPDVSVRFRAAPNAPWEEAKWVDIFKHIAEPKPPSAPAEEQGWLRRWGWIALAAAVTIMLLAWLLHKRRTRPVPPLPPEQWALRELERIEQTLLPPHGDAEAFHTQLSHVVRRYLAERFVPHAMQQTTAEFLDAVRQVPRLNDAQQGLLRDLFERCDLAKFARASTPPDECRHSAAMARDLIRQTVGG